MNKHQTSKITETDLYEPIRNYFTQKGYIVHGEVKNCDITAVKDGELIVVELKSSFNATLLIQAAKRQRVAEAVYIAIPAPKTGIFSRKWKDICYLIRRLELGLIIVSFLKSGPRVELVFDPAPFNREQSRSLNRKKRISMISEINGRHGDYNTGGSTRRKLMTAYKENAIQIACCLQKYGQLSPRRLKELGTVSKTGSILQKNFYGWFERLAPGLYGITPEGNRSLADYPELVEYYRNELEKLEKGIKYTCGVNQINNRIKAFIFDMDGVLTDTVEYHYQSFKRLADEEGVSFNRELNEHLRGLSREDSLALLFKDRILSPAELKRLMEKKNRYFLELITTMSPSDLLPGVKSLLEKLQKYNIKIGLASSSKNTEVILNRLGIKSYFDSVSDGYSVKKAKPAPDLFLHAAAGLGVQPSSCIVVEDAEAGIEAARAAKMFVIGIGPVKRVGKADLNFETLADIDLNQVICQFNKHLRYS